MEKLNLKNKVVVSDPCYKIGTWCQGILENVKEGQYLAQSYSQDNGTIVAGISLVHEDYINAELDYELQSFKVGVDSGQAGIFNYDYYEKYHKDETGKDCLNSNWFDRIGNMTYGRLANPDYVPFNETAEYKAYIFKLRTNLEKLKDEYPEIDIETKYIQIINDHDDKETEHKDFTDGLKACLSDVSTLLKQANGEIPIPDKTEQETALQDATKDIEFALYKAHREYSRSEAGSEYVYRNIASIVSGEGYVSSSGYGDGSYECLAAFNESGEIVGIKLDFTLDEDDEDE